MKFVFVLSVFLLAFAANGNADPLDEEFGYVDVRDGAHMFWVTYHTELPGDWSESPLIMWLQGGPGASGVGFGNFKELGPYDTNGNLREGRWTKKANLMFVDNPVGTGYSYVDDLSLLSKDNAQIASDLVALLTSVLNDFPDMQVMPFFVYAESYGGKMTADFAIALDAAIATGEINCNFQGIAMGDSWISPMDSVNTWGSFLYEMGFVNSDGQAAIEASAAKTQAAVDAEQWTQATISWSNTESVVFKQTDGVDFYNVLVPDSNAYSVKVAKTSAKKYSFMRPEIRDLYLRHVLPLQTRDSLDSFMNGPQAEAWNIPDGVVWDSQGGNVFNHLAGDFMVPVVASVEELLANSNIHVSVYTGDLDLICDTPGTFLWIDGMDYPQKGDFQNSQRNSLHVDTYPNNAAYVQRFERFSVFTILRSGHMVPIDVPQMALNMIDMITGYGAEAAAAAAKAKEVKPKNKVNLVHSHRAAKKVHQQIKEQIKEEVPKNKDQTTQKEHVKTVVEVKNKQDTPKEQVQEVKHKVEKKKEQATPKEEVEEQKKPASPKEEVKEKKEPASPKEEVEEQKEQASPKQQVQNKVEEKKEEKPITVDVKKIKKESMKPTNYEQIEIDEDISQMLKKKVFDRKYNVHVKKPEASNQKPVVKKEVSISAETPKVREIKAHVAKSVVQGRNSPTPHRRPIFH